MKNCLRVWLFLFPFHFLADQFPMPFDSGGQVKMLYDCRQRPRSVYLNGKVYVVSNAGGKAGAPAKSPTKPMAITHDLKSRALSKTKTAPNDDTAKQLGNRAPAPEPPANKATPEQRSTTFDLRGTPTTTVYWRWTNTEQG